MKFWQCSIILFFLSIIIGCKKDEKTSTISTARFGTLNNNYFLNQSITFINQSSDNTTTYQWDFGDGQSSQDANPIHHYSKGGTYKVTLTTNNNSTYYKNVRVFPTVTCYIIKNNGPYTLHNVKCYSQYTFTSSTLEKDIGDLAPQAVSDTIFTNSLTPTVQYNSVAAVSAGVSFTISINTYTTWYIY